VLFVDTDSMKLERHISGSAENVGIGIAAYVY
jgi:hypothetical protein